MLCLYQIDFIKQEKDRVPRKIFFVKHTWIFGSQLQLKNLYKTEGFQTGIDQKTSFFFSKVNERSEGNNITQEKYNKIISGKSLKICSRSIFIFR